MSTAYWTAARVVTVAGHVLAELGEQCCFALLLVAKRLDRRARRASR